jgi:hypothetical protein
MSEISQVRVRKMIMITEQGKEALSARIAWQAICRVHVLCSSPPHTRGGGGGGRAGRPRLPRRTRAPVYARARPPPPRSPRPARETPRPPQQPRRAVEPFACRRARPPACRERIPTGVSD